MSAALSKAPILPRLRVAGADATIRNGRPIIQKASRVPPALMTEARDRRDDLIAELTGEAANDGAITVPCARCGIPSRPFLAVINPDLWQCDACLPADANDHAYEAVERQRIVAEGKAAEPVLIDMPPSWSDATIEPTPGARCRCCTGASWWCEAANPKGWRCSTCYGSDHLPADRRREVVTWLFTCTPEPISNGLP